MEFYYRKKKYNKIMKDIEPIIKQLEEGNFVGDKISDLHLENSTYKVRAANTNTGSGKSNGYRLIYYVVKDDKEVYLRTIYSKKDDHMIPSNNDIADWIKEYC